jgi:hypothetical protein
MVFMNLPQSLEVVVKEEFSLTRQSLLPSMIIDLDLTLTLASASRRSTTTTNFVLSLGSIYESAAGTNLSP